MASALHIHDEKLAELSSIHDNSHDIQHGIIPKIESAISEQQQSLAEFREAFKAFQGMHEQY